ncbi:MAG: murein biosynthesis integral membrane protein MurJ [Phycisphaerae bacterium]|jgi:putative peptidoglycan lipid II flippase
MSSQMLQSARLVGVLTLMSRLLGLARDMAITATLGVGTGASAFWTAFQVPNLFRRLFGEGALSAASIPVLTETLSKDGAAAADRLAGRILGLLLVLLAGLIVVGEAVIAGLYWRYGGQEKNALVLTLAGLMLPYMLFICAAAMLGGVQNVFGRFASAAAAPIILNLFMIAAALAGPFMTPAEKRQVVLLAAAVVVSGVFQLAWQWAAARRLGLRLPLSLDTRDPTLRRIAVTMLPMILGLATVQLNTFADSLIAWWFVPEKVLRPGGAAEEVGPAVLSLAQRLYQFPLAIFASALATAIFPALSRHAAENDLPGLARTLSRGLRVTSFEGLPSMVGLILVREPLVALLFGRGRFQDWPEATQRVSFALFMYALGIWAFGVNQIVVRAYYAVGDPRTPLGVSVRNVALNLALGLLLVHTALKEAGLALATSICAVVQVVVLLRRLSPRVGRLEWRAIGTAMLRTAAATAIMAGGVLAVDRFLPAHSAAVRVGAMVVTGGLVFLASAWLLRCPEIKELARR